MYKRQAEAQAPAAPVGARRAYDMATNGWADFDVYDRGELFAGHRIAGPAIVEEGTSTTVFFSDQQLVVDELSLIHI